MVDKLNKSLKAIVYSKECYIVLLVGIGIFIVYMTPSKIFNLFLSELLGSDSILA